MAIYLDNHATTRVDPRVLDAMLPFFREKFGNSGSRSHCFGWEAAEAVDVAREQVAALLGADPREIVFTSGATESNNLALKGTFQARAADGTHIVSSPIEHPSITDTLDFLETKGCMVTYLPVDEGGRVRPEDVEAALTDKTILVTVMGANNEIGTIQPIREIAAIAARHGAWFHTDATQAVGKIDFSVDGIQLAALTGHKLYGPKGCGALYVQRGIELVPQQHGGGQERGLRPGTLNVPGIVGLGACCKLARLEHPEEAACTVRLRDRLQELLLAGLDGVSVNGDPTHRLPGNLHVSFRGLDSQALMLAVPDVAVSAGAACASGELEPSPVLAAIGADATRAGSSIRFGVGRFNTEREIDEAARLFVAAAKKLRAKARR